MSNDLADRHRRRRRTDHVPTGRERAMRSTRRCSIEMQRFLQSIEHEPRVRRIVMAGARRALHGRRRCHGVQGDVREAFARAVAPSSRRGSGRSRRCSGRSHGCRSRSSRECRGRGRRGRRGVRGRLRFRDLRARTRIFIVAHGQHRHASPRRLDVVLTSLARSGRAQGQGARDAGRAPRRPGCA